MWYLPQVDLDKLYAIFELGGAGACCWEEVGGVGYVKCLMLKLLHVEFKLFNKSLMFQFESDQWG